MNPESITKLQSSNSGTNFYHFTNSIEGDHSIMKKYYSVYKKNFHTNYSAIPTPPMGWVLINAGKVGRTKRKQPEEYFATIIILTIK